MTNRQIAAKIVLNAFANVRSEVAKLSPTQAAEVGGKARLSDKSVTDIQAVINKFVDPWEKRMRNLITPKPAKPAGAKAAPKAKAPAAKEPATTKGAVAAAKTGTKPAAKAPVKALAPAKATAPKVAALPAKNPTTKAVKLPAKVLTEPTKVLPELETPVVVPDVFNEEPKKEVEDVVEQATTGTSDEPQLAAFGADDNDAQEGE